MKQERRVIIELGLLLVIIICLFLNVPNQTINCSSPSINKQDYPKPRPTIKTPDHRKSMPPSCNSHKDRCISKLNPGRGPATMISLTNTTEHNVNCKFLNEELENNNATCGIELETIKIALNHVTPEDTVLEFGGRYATTTCALAVAQGNTGRLVAVEPDPKVWWVHQVNKIINNCVSTTVFGVVGPRPLSVISVGYTTWTVREKYMNQVGHYTWDQVERYTGFTFDTILFDCEGCYNTVIKENIEKFTNVKKIIMEYDVPNQGGGMELTLQSWEETKQSLDILKQLGFKHLNTTEYFVTRCHDNIRRDEEKDYSIQHMVGCHFILVK